MATVTNVLFAGNAGAIEVDMKYDDVSALIQSVSLRNDGTAGNMIVTLTRRSDGAVIFTRTHAFGAGLFTQNLTGLNLHMVSVVGKGGGTALQPPFFASFEWDSTV